MHVQNSERIISQSKACEFIIQILYILSLHKSRVTTLDMAWHRSWCDMSIVKHGQSIVYYLNQNWSENFFSQTLDYELITFLLYCPLAHPAQFYFDSHISEMFYCSKYSFSQFWTVFPIFGREKLGKTCLSQFIPFWTAKTGFGREKPNPVPGQYQIQWFISPCSRKDLNSLTFLGLYEPWKLNNKIAATCESQDISMQNHLRCS